MKTKIEFVEEMCDQAITRVDEAITKHLNGEDEDLSIQTLTKVKVEIEMMKKTLDVNKYRPGYPRNIQDSWPDKYGLVKYLVNVAYEYERKTK